MTNCDYCNQPIPDKVHPYTLKLELFPAIEPSLEVNEQELQVDFQAEMERLIKVMEAMDDWEVLKQEKLIYLAHRFTLCPACRNRLAERIEALSSHPQS